ncbi:MAG: hypothetical protein ABIJ21_00080 [Nanoarchaeota archaeon]
MADLFKEFIREYAGFEGKSEDEYAQKVMGAIQWLEHSFFIRIGDWLDIHPTRYHIEKKSPPEGKGWWAFKFFGDITNADGKSSSLEKPYLVFEVCYLPSQSEPFQTAIKHIFNPSMLEPTLKKNFEGQHFSFLHALTFIVGSFVKASATNLRVKQLQNETEKAHAGKKQIQERMLKESQQETLASLGVTAEANPKGDKVLEPEQMAQYADIFTKEVTLLKPRLDPQMEYGMHVIRYGSASLVLEELFDKFLQGVKVTQESAATSEMKIDDGIEKSYLRDHNIVLLRAINIRLYKQEITFRFVLYNGFQIMRCDAYLNIKKHLTGSSGSLKVGDSETFRTSLQFNFVALIIECLRNINDLIKR